MINNLLPYLWFKHEKKVEAYFNQETIDCNGHVTGDDNTKRIKITIKYNIINDEDEDFVGLKMAMEFNKT